MGVVVFHYKLKKYARWKIVSDEKRALEEIDGTNEDLKLTLYSTHHLVVSSNRTVQENVCLTNARDHVQVLCHEDNLQVHVKLQAHMHKFRIKFAPADSVSGPEHCLSCCKVLMTYVPVKDIAKNSKTNEPHGVDKASKSSLVSHINGVISISQMSKVITGEQEATLPLAYQQLVRPELDKKQLETILNLCLCDSSFPSFVAQVDKLLKAYIDDSNVDKSKSS